MRKLLKIIGHKLFDAIIIVWKLSWMSHFAMIGKKATDINQVQYLSMAIFSAITIGDWRTTWFMNGQIRYFFRRNAGYIFGAWEYEQLLNNWTYKVMYKIIEKITLLQFRRKQAFTLQFHIYIDFSSYELMSYEV